MRSKEGKDQVQASLDWKKAKEDTGSRKFFFFFFFSDEGPANREKRWR